MSGGNGLAVAMLRLDRFRVLEVAKTDELSEPPGFRVSTEPGRFIEQLFVEHTRLLTRLGIVGVSLTAGVDSQSTFAVTRHLARGPIFTFTYFRRDNERDGLSAREYLTTWCNRGQSDRRFLDMYSVTWPEGACQTHRESAA